MRGFCRWLLSCSDRIDGDTVRLTQEFLADMLGVQRTTVTAVAMLFLVGPRHPPVLDEEVPLGMGRFLLAIFALVMLVLCFTPVPFQL